LRKNIVFLCSTENYPAEFSANNSKIGLASRGLIEAGDQVTIINHPLRESAPNYIEKVTHGNIDCYTYRIGKNSLFNKLNFLRNVFKFLIKKRQKNGNIIIFECGSTSFRFLFALCAFAKFAGYRSLASMGEWHISHPAVLKAPRLIKLNYFLLDECYGWFVDGLLPVSTFLEKRAMKFHKPILKFPILADFSCASFKGETEQGDYYLYCGGGLYFEVIELLVKAFSLHHSRFKKDKLILVLNGAYGGFQYFDRIFKYIDSVEGKASIIVKQNLPFDELYSLYANAYALLIPLRENIQDISRFSQKTAEYLSAGRPIITGDVGEMKYYFTHKKNALVSSQYDAESYAQLMDFASENRALMDEIGAAGRQLGEEHFNYQKYGKRLSGFLDRLN
jgi:glycosyltransferase involved in cell wall biosynthesis